MRIGIDGRMYSESGVGRYIRNLISQLHILDNDNEYYIFLLKKDFESMEFSNLNFNKVLVDFKWYGIEEQIKFPTLLKKYNLDLMHFPHFNVPVFYGGRFIVTIHDLIHQNFSMKRATTHGPIFHKVKQLGYNKVFKNAIKKSEKILVPSNFVKEQLVKKWLIKDQKIMVTQEAVEEQLIAIATHCNRAKIHDTLKKFGITGPYIFYVGNAHPHKNVEGLIKAFLKIREIATSLTSPDSRNDDVRGLQLVLAGQDHYFWERLKKGVMDPRFREDIIFTGFVTDEELVALYKGAECFVMPSFEEGFGIPILEAMACNTPVVSSNGGSLLEVGGDAALYFNPYDIDDMLGKIAQVLEDEKLRKELIEKGQKRYKDFSWKKLAEQTLEIYKQSLEVNLSN